MSRQQPYQVSVGISAYNEEKNISNILKDILSQKQDNWRLKEILVYCDGCADNTVQKAKKVRSKLIKIVDNKDRKGKVFRVAQMFRDFKSDLFVLFDADLTFKDSNVIKNLIEPFYKRNKIVLVGGNTRPLLPKTFFERAVYSTFMVFDESRKKINGGNNIFGCNGGCMAIKKEFAKSLKFPNIINEDDFLYFSCLSKNLHFRHVRKAVVFYKLPNKFKDYLKQSFRSNPPAVILNFKKYFGDIVEKEYKRPKIFMIKNVLKVFKENPAEVAYISFINALIRPLYSLISKKFKLSWYTAESTK